MTKPNWCPQDVWDMSLKVMDSYLYGSQSAQEFIARAILAERERCAVVADRTRVAGCSTPRQAARTIAAAIRATP
jgi:hypothetical protein